MEHTNELHEYIGHTLVDITSTGALSSDNKSRNQQRNWETVVQTLGLRTQTFMLTAACVLELDLSMPNKTKFGEIFTGKQFVWSFKFGTEHPEVFENDKSNIGLLEEDFSDVPFVAGLSETVKFTSHAFVSDGEETNIYFEKVTR